MKINGLQLEAMALGRSLRVELPKIIPGKRERISKVRKGPGELVRKS
jgi:hypothetical protein